jgi:chemotaxis protein CheX
MRDQLREPFVAAVSAALGEMAGVEAVARADDPKEHAELSGGISAVVELQSEVVGPLILRFPAATATALTARILAGVTDAVDSGLVRDCVGEIANVVAGQAKAMLAGTAYHFVFAVPRVVDDGVTEPAPGRGRGILGITFDSELGVFTLLLALSEP